MNKLFLSASYWALCGVLFAGIVKVSGGSKLFAFSHSLDLHADEEGIKKEAERRMRQDAADRKEAQYWKDYHERQAREKKEKEEKERKRAEEEKRRKDEEKKAWEDHRRDLDRKAKEKEERDKKK